MITVGLSELAHPKSVLEHDVEWRVKNIRKESGLSRIDNALLHINSYTT